VVTSHVMCHLMGKGVVRTDARLLNNRVRPPVEVRVVATHHVRLAAKAGGAVRYQLDQIGTVGIAQGMGVVYKAELGIGQIGLERTGFCVVDLCGVYQSDPRDDSAVLVGEVGLGNTQLNQALDSCGAFRRRAGGRSVHHQQIEELSRSRLRKGGRIWRDGK